MAVDVSKPVRSGWMERREVSRVEMWRVVRISDGDGVMDGGKCCVSRDPGCGCGDKCGVKVEERVERVWDEGYV